MRFFLAIIVLFGLFVSVPAFAQNSGVTEYDFENDQVVGTLAKPVGEDINGQRVYKRGSLIKVRANFVRELLISTDEI